MLSMNKIHLTGACLVSLAVTLILCIGSVFADDAYAPQNNPASATTKAESPVGFCQRGDGVTRIKDVLIIDKDADGGYVTAGVTILIKPVE